MSPIATFIVRCNSGDWEIVNSANHPVFTRYFDTKEEAVAIARKLAFAINADMRVDEESEQRWIETWKRLEENSA